MGLKTQTDAAEKIHNSTFPGEDVDRPAQVGSVAGVKRDCVSPSAPTRRAWLRSPRSHGFFTLGDPCPP